MTYTQSSVSDFEIRMFSSGRQSAFRSLSRSRLFDNTFYEIDCQRGGVLSCRISTFSLRYGVCSFFFSPLLLMPCAKKSVKDGHRGRRSAGGKIN